MFLNNIFKNILPTPMILHALLATAVPVVERLSRRTAMTATIRDLEGQDEASILREIHSALSGLKFGSVEITVHNGQVVQIERKEKFRLQPTGKNA